MKRATWVFSFLCIILILAAGCGKKDQTTTAQPEPPQNFPSSDFTSADMCQYCHLEIYEQWRGSMHANAYTNPVYMAELSKTSKDSGGAADAFCSGCHTPIGLMAGEIPPVDGSALSATARQGVTCDLCHSITEITGSGHLKFRVTPGKTKYGSLEDPINNPIHGSEYNKYYEQADYCGVCHDIVHPKNGLALASTFTEWKESNFSHKRITCQDCHMTPGPGVTKPNPGYAATGAPKKRDHVWTHYMTGGNVHAHRKAGFDKYAGMVEENLKGAATIFLGLPDKLSLYQDAKISVRVRNDGAGHYLPTGLSNFKEMWLEVVVRDDSGRVVYQSGVLDSQGNIPEKSAFFRQVFGDAAGKEASTLWDAATVLSDTRIPPQKYVDEFFEVPGLVMPGTLHISVRLLYRSISQGRLESLFGSGTSPLVEMAKAEGKIRVSLER